MRNAKREEGGDAAAGKAKGGVMRQEDLSERTKRFALRVMELVALLPNTRQAQFLGHQLLKAGTSIGANYREAKRARSRADFISKIGICEQEAEETIYWLELLGDAGLLRGSELQAVMDEAKQLLAIFITSGRTAKGGR